MDVIGKTVEGELLLTAAQHEILDLAILFEDLSNKLKGMASAADAEPAPAVQTGPHPAFAGLSPDNPAERATPRKPKRKPAKKVARKTPPKQTKPDKTQAKPATNREAAIVVLRNHGSLTARALVRAMVAAGVKFKSADPASAVGVMLKTYGEDFERTGTAPGPGRPGLYGVTAKHRPQVKAPKDKPGQVTLTETELAGLNQAERDVVEADSRLLTSEGKAKRLELLRRLGREAA